MWNGTSLFLVGKKVSSAFISNSIPTPFFFPPAFFPPLLSACVQFLVSFQPKAALSGVCLAGLKHVWAGMKWREQPPCGGVSSAVADGGSAGAAPSTALGAARQSSSPGAPTPSHGGSGPDFPSYTRGMSLFKGKNGEAPVVGTVPATGGTNLSQLEMELLRVQCHCQCRASEQSMGWELHLRFE